MYVNKMNCTANTEGQIVVLKSKGLNSPSIIVVEYQVGSELYEVVESVNLKSEIIKLGFLPIGQKKIPVMPNATVGSKTTVVYNPENPLEAYIRDNEGKINC